MNIFFDLDGTLIDSKLRLYKLFQKLVVNSNLTYEQYWYLKQNKISNRNILEKDFNYTVEQLAEFDSKWMKLIESSFYLDFDKPISDVEKTLAFLSEHADLYLCTARQYKAPALEQMANFGLSQYFTDMLVTEKIYTKNELITKNVKNISSDDWMVGDTGYDVKEGKLLGINTCAVTNGFLSEEVLKTYNPDMLVKSVADLETNTMNSLLCWRS